MSNRFASPTLVAKLKERTKAEQNWYMTQGEPECIVSQVLHNGKLAVRLYPALKGIVVGDPAKTEEQAIGTARAVRELMLAEEVQPFDVAEAEMDDEALELQHLFNEHSVRIEEIAHIGTMQDGEPAEPLTEAIERLLEKYRDQAHDDLACIKKHFEHAEEDELKHEDIIMLLNDHGLSGFLIVASIPEMEFHENGSASIHYGTRHTNLIYGSNFNAACRKAIKWARETQDAGRRKAQMAKSAEESGERT